jgi:tetratricopeptide (TPR) repeat protein
MSFIITPKRLAVFILCNTGLMVAGAIALQIKPQIASESDGMSMSQQEKFEGTAASSLFGQFRTSMADFLWMKTDKYLHNGVELRGMTEKEKKANLTQAQTKTNDGLQHSDATTVVPAAAGDWRGFYGSLERQVEPYKNMEHHEHASPKEALPLFRLMTVSNPHFIPGFKVGGAMMLKQKPKEAVAFIAEGIKNNPNSVELLTLMGGEVYTRHFKQYDTGISYLEKALEVAKKRDPKSLSDYELEEFTEAYTSAYRWMILAYREKGDHVQGKRYAKECLEHFPQDVTATHYLKEHP